MDETELSVENTSPQYTHAGTMGKTRPKPAGSQIYT